MDAVALHRHVLARASTDDLLQHVYVSVHADGGDLVLFVAQPTLLASESVASRLTLACLGDSPATSGWTLAHCGGTLPGSLARRLLLGEGRILPLQPPDVEGY
ncbi:hypothetical protein [Streptomyces sp. NBC_00344]|uniref:hypothetical protein n=1 Tax=Streptomyces sp. NBC_00344 TaxID=2975720 RepID=UPI002E1DACE9